ncbi:hypothetical protein KGQ29_04565 [Patescibacteria group bacterium]|nr:hypothetical protein [Patescibacteria group bacterium]
MGLKTAFIGKKVLVRAGSAGVHYGTLVERDGQELLLSNAKRIWSWKGALSLSEIASSGLNVKESKISVAVDEIILTTAVEVILISEASNLP